MSKFFGGEAMRGLIEIGNLNVELASAPIEPSWILEGKPTATSCALSRSADGTATTLIWHCSEGKFNWYYDFDETILILEGSIVLESDNLRPTRYGPGDVIFFKNGAHAKWHVEGHVKKLAFCRKTQPLWLGFAVRAIGKLRRIFLPTGGQKAASLVGAG